MGHDVHTEQKKQREDAQAIKRLLNHKDEMVQELLLLGLPGRSIAGFLQALEQESGVFLLPEKWLQHPASVGLRDLWLGETSRGVALLVPIKSLQDVTGLQESVAAFPGIRYMDQVADFTSLLKSYRRRAMFLVGIAYLVVFVLLVVRYHLQGFALMLPPLLAAFITVGCLGIFGHAFNLMHCLALLLILGMGVDYTIFLSESVPSAESTTQLALTLSAITTALSFGLLSVSSQAALQAIGLTTLLGIVCAWLFSPLVISRRLRS